MNTYKTPPEIMRFRGYVKIFILAIPQWLYWPLATIANSCHQSKPKEAFAGWLRLIHSSVDLTSEMSVGYMEFVLFYQAQSDSRDL